MKVCNKAFAMSLLASAALSGTGNSAYAESGARLFEEHCASCHIPADMDGDLVAPPIFGVQNHYIKAYPQKEQYVSAIVAWLEKPSEDKAQMPGAIRKFGLMPEIDISADDAVSIGEFLYEAKFDKPGWYEEHYRKEHGEAPPSGGMGKMGHGSGHGKGMGHGQGMGHGEGHGKGHGRSWWQRLWGE